MDDQWSQVDDGKPQEAGNAGVRQEQARQVRVSTKKKWNFYDDTLWLFNIAMEHGPFIDDFPIKTSIYKTFSMAMLNNQMIDMIEIICW